MSDTLFERLYGLFSTAAFGWNQRLRGVLDTFHEDLGVPKTYAFYEYFFHHPLKRSEKQTRETANDVFLIFPFADRILEKAAVIPVIIEVKEKGDAVRKLDFVFPGSEHKHNLLWTDLTHTWLAWGLYFMWSETKKIEFAPKETQDVFGETARLFSYEVEVSGLLGKPERFEMYWISTRGVTIKDLYEKLPPPGGSTFDQSLQREAGIFRCFYPHLETKEIPSIALPLASHDLFYGSLWIMLPCLQNVKLSETKVHAQLEKLAQDIGKVIIEAYAPTIALLHNHFLETLCSDNADLRKSILDSKPFRLEKYENRDIYYVNPFFHCKDALDPIESGFYRLWEKRKIHFGDLDRVKKRELEDTLVFKDYLVCSPTMIKVVRNVITRASTLKKSGKSLPTALVVGGPGSGKETIAKMLRLFTETYCMGGEYTINMAALRPALVTGPLMVGLKKPFAMVGMLASIRKETLSNFARKFLAKNGKLKSKDVERLKEDKVKTSPDYPYWPTVILDELNSMDPDSQGTLLRFLENSEILALGSIKDEETEQLQMQERDLVQLTDCLVVGVMNEDPDEITREEAIDFIKSRSYLGGLLGDWLYESFMKLRRLRPDLKYRMIRGGKFVLPLLRDRREDIPILFLVYLRKELNAICEGKPEPYVPTECYEYLMSPSFTWPGNIRQLQALAKDVATLVIPVVDNDKQYFRVSLGELRRAMEEMGVEEQQEDQTSIS